MRSPGGRARPSRRARSTRRRSSPGTRKLAREVSRRDRMPRRDAGRAATRRSRARCSRRRDPCSVAGRERIEPPGVDPDAVSGRILLRHLDRNRVCVHGDDGLEAEQRRRDRDDARTAARVEQARRRTPSEELEARPRRGMRACAERAARVDDDGDLIRGRRVPGRADPETAGAHRMVELAPAFLPAGLDRCADRTRERISIADAPLRRVYAASSTVPGRSISSKPAGASTSSRARALSASSAATRTETRRRPAHRSALFRRRKNPSSSSSDAYAVSSVLRSNSSSRPRCSSVSREGTATSSRT